MLFFTVLIFLHSADAQSFNLATVVGRSSACGATRGTDNPLVVTVNTVSNPRISYVGAQPTTPLECYFRFCLTHMTKSLIVEYSIKSYGNALRVNMFDDNWVFPKGGINLIDKSGGFNATWKIELNTVWKKSCVNVKVGNKNPSNPSTSSSANIVIDIKTADAKESSGGIDLSAWNDVVAAGMNLVTIIIIIVCVIVLCPIIICIICCCVGGACAANCCGNKSTTQPVVVVAQQGGGGQQMQHYPPQGYNQQAGYQQQQPQQQGYNQQQQPQQQGYNQQPQPGYNRPQSQSQPYGQPTPDNGNYGNHGNRGESGHQGSNDNRENRETSGSNGNRGKSGHQAYRDDADLPPGYVEPQKY